MSQAGEDYRSWSVEPLSVELKMQSVVQTREFLADVKSAGMSDEEREQVVDYISTQPTATSSKAPTAPAKSGSRDGAKARVEAIGSSHSSEAKIFLLFCSTFIPKETESICPKPTETNLARYSVLSPTHTDTELRGMSRAGERILSSARQALAFARGETTEGFIVHVPKQVDVKKSAKRPASPRKPSPTASASPPPP